MITTLIEPGELAEHSALAQTLVKSIEELLIDQKPSLTVKPPSLSGKPFSIKITQETVQNPLTQNEEILRFRTVVIDDRNGTIIPKFGVTIEFHLQFPNILGQGRYGNFTKKNTQEDYQFKGGTRFFSPIDDAISQAVANFYSKKVVREVQTKYPSVEESFISRGFQKTRTAEDGMAELKKIFSPPTKVL